MIYIVCFLTSSAFAWLASHAKDKAITFICSAISILILCVLGGLRAYSIGTDVMTYIYPDYRVAEMSWGFINFLTQVSYRESAYLFLVYISCKFFGHPNWALFFCQLITVTCFYIAAYRHRKIVSLPFFILVFCFVLYNQTYNVMRQHLANSIILMGINEMESRHYFKFSIYILAASLFHTSALIAFPFFIGFHWFMTSEPFVRNTLGLRVLTMLGMILSMFLFRQIILYFTSIIPGIEKYAGYVMSRRRWDTQGWQVSIVLIMATEFLVMTLYSKNVDKCLCLSALHVQGGRYFYKFMLLFCIMYQTIVSFFSGRLLIYFYGVNVLLLATLPQFVRDKHLRFILSAGIILVLAFYWWNTYVRGGASETYPYKSILD